MTETEQGCNCDNLDDDLIEAGWTCHNCYTYRKDNPDGEETNA
jgi:hypothetical protein